MSDTNIESPPTDQARNQSFNYNPASTVQQLNVDLQQQSQTCHLSMIYPQFQQQYNKSLLNLNYQSREKIKKWTLSRQKQNYLYFIQPQKFVQFSKELRIQNFLQHNNPLLTMLLLQAMQERQVQVEHDILNNILTISDTKKRANMNKQNNQQQPQAKQPTLQQLKAEQQQSRKKHKEIIRSQRKQRERIEKLKQREQQLRKQHELQKIQQQKKQKQQLKKHNSQMLTQKITEQHQRRDKQQKLLLERNSDYKFIIKSWTTNQLLHQKMERKFKQRYDEQMDEDRKKVHSERSRLLLNSRVEDLNITQHDDKYMKWRADNEAIRASKMQEQNRMVELYEKQLRKYKKPKKQNQKDNSDQEGSQDEDYSKDVPKDKTYHEVKEQKHKLAMEKRKKMQTYWESFVKEEKQPKIDPKKQQQLQNLIESLEKSHKLRKVKNQKGQYVYEQLKSSDPAMRGLQYLQYSREIGRMRKSLKPKDTHDTSSTQQQNHKQKNATNYLKQLRDSRSQSLNTERGMKNKLSFLQKKDLTFHDKLQRVEKEAFKLQQMTKQSENQLKYGKFKTSEEILQYKEDIDNNHVEILKMKLMLAVKGNQ